MPCAEQKLEMLLAGGLGFKVHSLFKKGDYWEKKSPWSDPEESIGLNCVYHFGTAERCWKCDSMPAGAVCVSSSL